jgi:hypothetical protein
MVTSMLPQCRAGKNSIEFFIGFPLEESKKSLLVCKLQTQLHTLFSVEVA